MRRLLFLAPLFLFFSCKQKDKTPGGGGSADAAFQKLSEEYIKGYLDWRPANAVYIGIHDYDGKMPDLSPASIKKELDRLKDFDQRMADFDTSALSSKMSIDYRMLQLSIKEEIFDIEELKSYASNPMDYLELVDLSIYVKKNFAPLEQRLKYIIELEEKFPSLMDAARANLQDSIPKPFIETAFEIANGGIEFIKGELVDAMKEVKNDSLMKAFHAANEKAIAALKSYVDWLRKEKLPRANNNYAIGTENYRKMLLYGEAIDKSPEEILAIGLEELKKEQAAFAAAAKVINPSMKPIDVFREVQKEHPSADSLISGAKKRVESIRQFVIDHNIATIPSEDRIQVEETPQYARATSSASMDSPGPFEEKAREAYYYITPVDPSWTEKQKLDWLSYFNYYSTDIVTIHEAYPGHYVQGLHLNASSATRIEKMFGSYAFSEGWAHYCEKMMIDEGFGNTGDPILAAKYRLTQSSDALLRLCRLCVSIKMHCQGMTIKEGTKFFMDNCYQGEKPAYQESLRGSFDPGYLFYTLGKFEILKLREDYKKQEGANFSLKKFHDQLLDNGEPMIRLLRELMLKDKSKWNEVL